MPIKWVCITSIPQPLWVLTNGFLYFSADMWKEEWVLFGCSLFLRHLWCGKSWTFFGCLAGSEGGRRDWCSRPWCDETSSISRSLDDFNPVLANLLPHWANSFLSSWAEARTSRSYITTQNHLRKFCLSKASSTHNLSRLILQIAEIPTV